MREIKFRAWLKEKKEIVDVEEIDFMNKVINYIDHDYENNRQEIRGAYFEDIEVLGNIYENPELLGGKNE